MLPQEIELWYVLPIIRKELAKVLKEKHGLSQSKIAKILQVSPAAISQYNHKKRAKSVTLNSDLKQAIKSSAVVLAKNPELFFREMAELTHRVRNTEFVCELHKVYDSDIKLDCRDCFFSGIDKGWQKQGI